MSTASSSFASHARSRSVTFICAVDARVGAYDFREGDKLRVTVDSRGQCFLQAEWAEGSIPVPAGVVNYLANDRLVKDESNFRWVGSK